MSAYPNLRKWVSAALTLAVFAVFSITYLGERFTLNHMIGFALIAAGAVFIFKGPL